MGYTVDTINPQRIRKLNNSTEKEGPVVYWMSRDQRSSGNWALSFACQKAERKNAFAVVAFCLVPEFLGAGLRQYSFMIEGLKEVEHSLAERNIPFFVLTGRPDEELPQFIRRIKAGALVCDFDPLKVKMKWKEGVIRRIDTVAYDVDAHNIVPCWEASEKQEYSARTLRIKINKKLDRFLETFPAPEKQDIDVFDRKDPVDWPEIEKALNTDNDVPPVKRLKPGEGEAFKAMERFIEKGLSGYADNSNDPNSSARSDLSPYLHFGQISAQDVYMEVVHCEAAERDKDAFLEELLVRRELSDNFCFYNADYDSMKGFPDWAVSTLQAHAGDLRSYIYDRHQFEAGETHDELWNAAQLEMVKTGKMHGYMRMYWAKKILEWTRTPAEAFDTAVYLNDRYELDGRDPNGYTGIAWSIGGVHDRAWKERSVFGKIRYMSYAGCRRKFDVDAYVSRIRGME